MTNSKNNSIGHAYTHSPTPKTNRTEWGEKKQTIYVATT